MADLRHNPTCAFCALFRNQEPEECGFCAFFRDAEKEPEEQCDRAVRYPYEDGETIVIGPKCFAMKDGSVLSWRGQNYIPQSESCIDCDQPIRDCSCESVLRCSCDLPDVACVCSGQPKVRRFHPCGGAKCSSCLIMRGKQAVGKSCHSCGGTIVAESGEVDVRS